MPSKVNRQWRLIKNPVGTFKESDFRLTEAPIPAPHDGQFLVRNVCTSLDPTFRLWASGKETYFPPMPLGEVFWGLWVGKIEESRNPNFPKGAYAAGLWGLQEYAVSDGKDGAVLIPSGIEPQTWYGVFGHIGMTAYFGLFDIGKPKAGETVVVSGAAGAVGSLAGQMAKIRGCRVVGIAGSQEKCSWIRSELGFDAAINYKTENVSAALKEHCPKGIDVYFDNVGGNVLDAALAHINLRARIALCGMISQYNSDTWSGPSNLMELVYKRAKIEGFLVLDYTERAGEAIGAIAEWLQQGKIKYRVDVVNGFENAITAINKLYDGSNRGKLLVKVSDA